MPNAFDNPELYEAITLGGVRSPGVVTLSGHDRVIGWDIKKGPGQSGATTTRTSEEPRKFKASFYLVRDLSRGVDDFASWEAFATVVRSTVSGANPKPLDVYHPDLADNDINSVVLESFGGAAHDGMGGVTYTIGFLEYRPPKSKGGTASGSRTRAKPTKESEKTDPNAAALAELARLTEEYKRTPWG